MSEPTCENCRFAFWPVKDYHLNMMICRRNPPAVTECNYARFPVVDTDDWCGEWEPVSSKMEHTEERPTFSGLLACPFCGSHKLELSTGERFWLYECGSCECEGPPAASVATAIELWNARAEVKK